MTDKYAQSALLAESSKLMTVCSRNKIELLEDSEARLLEEHAACVF